ncbi:MAG: choice-of-anchor B family protein [Ardenticatenaceae bacterium]|nr:choice-of-anchor B family protein [Ardenticatenaceae bacterium]
MNKHMPYWTRSLFLVLIISLFVLTLSRFAPQTAVAQTSQDKADKTEPTQQMINFLADQQSPEQNLMSMPITPCVGGMAGTYPCNNIDLLAFMPLATIGGGSGNDSWGWTDPLDGKEYAIMGRTNGTAFIDISDPLNPVYLGNLPTHTGSSSWRDIKTYADHAFIVSDLNGSHGMQIFDLTELRNVVAPPVTFSETAHYNGVGSAHNIVINEDTGYAFIVGASACSGGLHMVDISNPTSPVFAGCFSSDGYTHDAQCVVYDGPDAAHVGQEICLNSNEDTLTIVDVTNKAAPVQLARTPYAGSSYTHQGWITEDHTYFLLDDELDESNSGHNTRTYIWDVSDLDNPVLIGNHTSTVGAIDHNQYVKGNYTYQANYRAGLRILDITDIANANLFEEAYFDIYPSSNSANFNGAWSVYPYFDSGVVIVSGIEQGLFILQPTSLAADFSVTATPNSQSICVPNNAAYNISVNNFSGFGANVTLSAAGQPTPPNSVSFSVNNQAPPYTSTMTVGTTGASAGTYDIDVVGMSPTTTHTTTVQLLLNSGAPGATTLNTPADGDSGVSTTPTFAWTTITEASSYYLEVATDAAFSSIVYTATINAPDTNHTASTTLNTDTVYYWRVTTANGCGSGTASSVFSFSTGVILCSTPALAIPDNDPLGISNDLVIGGSGSITDLDISLDVSHTWVGDLIFTLEHVDTGTTATFYDRPGYTGSGFGCSSDNVDVTANDEGPDGDIESQCATNPAISGNRVGGDPANSSLLAAFDGESLSGTWRLTASDNAGGDTGTINEWCIIPVTEAVAPTIEVAPSSLSSDQAANTQVVQTLTISNTGDADLDWDIFEDASSGFGGSWSDNFDSYATGSQMHGQGGWKGWDNSPAAGALTSNAEALSAPNSVDILGASDLVHEYSGYTSGQWIYTAWQFVPDTFAGTSYFIMLNTYADGGSNNWSVQVQFDSASNLVLSDNDGATLPLIKGQWVEIRLEIDLDADVQTFYYDGQMLYQKSWVDGVSGGGVANIAAVDLFANNASTVYYDDISLAAPLTTCDAADPIDWVSVMPMSGTVPALSATSVDVTFDSTGYGAGVYTGTLCINSNDATDPLISVPLTMTVLPNAAPIAADDAYTTTQDVALTVSAPGVLANDTDGDGDSLTAVLNTDVTSGTLALHADGSFTYTPTAGFEGTATFTYQANDGIDSSNVATVTITVVNTAPVAVADSYTTTEGITLTVSAPGVLDNDSDADGDGLTADLNTTTANGTLTLNTDGSFTYVPDAGFAGTDSFTYHANDGTDDSDTVTVTITVEAETTGYTIYLPFVSKN